MLESLRRVDVENWLTCWIEVKTDQVMSNQISYGGPLPLSYYYQGLCRQKHYLTEELRDHLK